MVEVCTDDLHMNCLDVKYEQPVLFLSPDSDSRRRNHHDQEEQEDVTSLITAGYINKDLIYHTSVCCIIHSNKQEINITFDAICTTNVNRNIQKYQTIRIACTVINKLYEINI